MKIVIAPDSFKGSLSAMTAATCIEKGFSQVFKDAQLLKMPLADGGEGTVELLQHALQGELKTNTVCGPLHTQVIAHWALLDNGATALIEIAQTSGLALLTPAQYAPAITSSFGTGQLIKRALDCGVTKIILALGGSASNDAGAGIAQALGAKLHDAQGKPIALGGLALQQLQLIDLSDVDPRCKNIEFIVACDVSNPLCGQQGASYIFAPQKGANKKMAAQLDSAIQHFAQLAAPITGIDHTNSQGFGAAGGAPMGLSLLFDIQMISGIEMVLDMLGADYILNNADLVITGEGKMDKQTAQGKAPYGIAKRAHARGIAVIAICGALGSKVDAQAMHMQAVFSSVRATQPLTQVLLEADENLTRSARNIAAILKVGQEIITK